MNFVFDVMTQKTGGAGNNVVAFTVDNDAAGSLKPDLQFDLTVMGMFADKASRRDGTESPWRARQNRYQPGTSLGWA